MKPLSGSRSWHVSVCGLMREFLFDAARVRVHPDCVESCFFEDGSICVFHPPVEKPDFIWAANYAGYADPLQFGLEHDVLHHHLAEVLGWERSHVVWWAAHGEPDEPATKDWRDLEEHIVVRMQRYWATGERDEFGVLESSFGRNLCRVAREALLVVRPWLD